MEVQDWVMMLSGVAAVVWAVAGGLILAWVRKKATAENAAWYWRLLLQAARAAEKQWGSGAGDKKREWVEEQMQEATGRKPGKAELEEAVWLVDREKPNGGI